MAKKKGFGIIGYKSPPNLELASRQIRAWIRTVGQEEAIKTIVRWMRVPTYPVSHFIFPENVRPWVKWLLRSELTMVSAEIRALWYSFERKVLPNLEDLILNRETDFSDEINEEDLQAAITEQKFEGEQELRPEDLPTKEEAQPLPKPGPEPAPIEAVKKIHVAPKVDSEPDLFDDLL